MTAPLVAPAQPRAQPEVLLCDLLFELAATDPILLWALSNDAPMSEILAAHEQVVLSLLEHPDVTNTPGGAEAFGRLLGVAELMAVALEAGARDQQMAELTIERSRAEITGPLALLEVRCP